MCAEPLAWDLKEGRAMYIFAIAALLGLGILALAMIAERYVLSSERRERWMVLLVALGIVTAWITNFNMWGLWGVAVRADWIGVTLTGLALAGLAIAWHEVLRLLSGLERKLHDEAATLEKAEGLRRVA
jgi:hypothetical protein